MSTEQNTSELCTAHNKLMFAQSELFTQVGCMLAAMDAEQLKDPEIQRLAKLYQNVDNCLKARNKALANWKPTLQNL